MVELITTFEFGAMTIHNVLIFKKLQNCSLYLSLHNTKVQQQLLTDVCVCVFRKSSLVVLN